MGIEDLHNKERVFAMKSETKYIEDATLPGFNDVVFIANDSGRKLVRNFDSPWKAMKFVNKLKHSKRCTLVSYPDPYSGF